MYLSLNGSWASPVIVSPGRIPWMDLAHHMPYPGLRISPLPGLALHAQPCGTVPAGESHPNSRLVLPPLPQLPHRSLQLVELSAWPSGHTGPIPGPKGYGPSPQGSLVSFPVPHTPPGLLRGGSVPSVPGFRDLGLAPWL